MAEASFDSWSVPAAKTAIGQLTLRRVGADWARYRLGTFLAVTRSKTPFAAEQRLSSATSAGIADAWASRAYLRQLSGQKKQAELFFERALEDGAQEALSLTLYGRFLVSEILVPGSDRAKRARQVLRRAIATDPTFVEPRALLGSTYLYLPPEDAKKEFAISKRLGRDCQGEPISLSTWRCSYYEPESTSLPNSWLRPS